MSVDLARDIIDYCLEQPLSYWETESTSILGNFNLSLKDVAYPSFNTVINVDIRCNQQPRREIWVHITLDKKLISTLQLSPMYYNYYKAQLLQKYVGVTTENNLNIGVECYFNNLQDSEKSEIVELLYTLKNYNKWIEVANQKSYWVILDNGLSISVSKNKNVEMKLFYFLSSCGTGRDYILTVHNLYLTNYFGRKSYLLDDIWNNIPKSTQELDTGEDEPKDDKEVNFIRLIKSSIKSLK